MYKALHYLQYGDRDSAIKELKRLEDLWDGRVFADAYYKQSGLYETYKSALALYTYKTISYRNNVDNRQVFSEANVYKPIHNTLQRQQGRGRLKPWDSHNNIINTILLTSKHLYTKTSTHDRDYRCYYINSYSNNHPDSITSITTESSPFMAGMGREVYNFLYLIILGYEY